MGLIHSSTALLVFNQQKLFHPETRFLCFIHMINTNLTQSCCEKMLEGDQTLEQIPTTLQLGFIGTNTLTKT